MTNPGTLCEDCIFGGLTSEPTEEPYYATATVSIKRGGEVTWQRDLCKQHADEREAYIATERTKKEMLLNISKRPAGHIPGAW